MNSTIQTVAKGLLILSVLVLSGAAYADTKPPNVAILLLEDGQTVTGSIGFFVTANDKDGVDRVEFYIDDSYHARDTDRPYFYRWETEAESDGSHTITVKAFDNDGNESSASISVIVDNGVSGDTTPPTVDITEPETGDTVSGTTKIEVDAFDDGGMDRVEFWVESDLISTDDKSPYSYSWDTESVDDGEAMIVAKAFDDAGNQDFDYVVVTVDNGATGDTTPPTVDITEPETGDTVSGTTKIEVDAFDDGGMDRVEFWIDSVLKTTDDKIPYSYRWDTESVDDGETMIVAKAFDDAGNQDFDYVVVTVSNGSTGDTTPPTVSITAPDDGETVSGATTIEVTATDAGGIDRVEFWIDGEWAGVDLDNLDSLYSWNWDTESVGNGGHSIFVKAYDNFGNMGDETRNVIVQNGAKTITKYYNAGDQQVARYSNAEGLVYFHKDHLGSTSRVTNTAGTLVKRVGYTPYGSDSYTEDLGLSVNLDFLFTGQEKDDTGLYYYGSRYYDPELGRFTTSDALIPSLYNPQGLNPYSYCFNNPVNFVDPDGELAFLTVVFIGAWIGGVTAAITGGDVLQGMFMGAITAGVGYGVSLAVSTLGLNAVASAVISGAITGGIMAAGTGGDIAEGFMTGAVTGLVAAGAGEYFEESLVSGESVLSTYSEEMGRIAGGMAGGAASGAMFTIYHGGNLFDNMIGGAFSAGVSATASMLVEMDIYDKNAREDQPGWMTGKSEAEIKAALLDLGWDGKSDIIFEGIRGLDDNAQPMYSNDWSDVNNKGFYHKNLFGFVDGKLVDLYYGPKGWEFNTQINRLHEYVFKTEIYSGTAGVTLPMYGQFQPSGLPNGYLLRNHNCQDATEFAIDELAR